MWPFSWLGCCPFASARCSRCTERTTSGGTPLMFATRKGHGAVVALFRAGAPSSRSELRLPTPVGLNRKISSAIQIQVAPALCVKSILGSLF